MHAESHGVPFRPPKDIDVVVGNYTDACDAIGGYKNASTFEIVDRGAKEEGTTVEHKAFRVRIDVIAAGTRLGTLQEVDTTSFAGKTVLSLTALVEQLEKRGDSGSADLEVAKKVREKVKT